jgi:hypothetical protein
MPTRNPNHILHFISNMTDKVESPISIQNDVNNLEYIGNQPPCLVCREYGYKPAQIQSCRILPQTYRNPHGISSVMNALEYHRNHCKAAQLAEGITDFELPLRTCRNDYNVDLEAYSNSKKFWTQHHVMVQKFLDL